MLHPCGPRPLTRTCMYMPHAGRVGIQPARGGAYPGDGPLVAQGRTSGRGALSRRGEHADSHAPSRMQRADLSASLAVSMQRGFGPGKLVPRVLREGGFARERPAHGSSGAFRGRSAEGRGSWPPARLARLRCSGVCLDEPHRARSARPAQWYSKPGLVCARRSAPTVQAFGVSRGDESPACTGGASAVFSQRAPPGGPTGPRRILAAGGTEAAEVPGDIRGLRRGPARSRGPHSCGAGCPARRFSRSRAGTIPPRLSLRPQPRRLHARSWMSRPGAAGSPLGPCGGTPSPTSSPGGMPGSLPRSSPRVRLSCGSARRGRRASFFGRPVPRSCTAGPVPARALREGGILRGIPHTSGATVALRGPGTSG